ncbi:hypothetical protein CBS115989_2903 [Aspergillus niger]|nr:hypothetical protein CBS115989_2903 [Aspergillus niger]KAI2847253.1 hypothetical protein CBS11350_3262 [Aspergillus niger]KAI2856977.1 hypothetical protein CBS11232_3412 [Aspergillus niger]KAI2877645.1 hypothetical protein CBS115988_3772 [Aspergillus niger]KAI2936961.1 hypothetical protein CBS147321_8175 [Aspergillus niger]
MDFLWTNRKSPLSHTLSLSLSSSRTYTSPFLLFSDSSLRSPPLNNFTCASRAVFTPAAHPTGNQATF